MKLYTLFFVYKQHFYKQCQVEIGKNLSKSYATPEAELLINMFKKQACLYQWDYMINCNDNENDNGRVDHNK